MTAAPHYEDLKLSNFGFQMRMSGFTGFLAWSGMGMAVLGILVSMALLTLPSDLNLGGKFHPVLDVLELDINDEAGRILSGLMYGVGTVLLLASGGWMLICFLLREYNKNRNLAKVTSVLNVICYLEAGFSIILWIVQLAAWIYYSESISAGGALGTFLATATVMFILCSTIHGVKVHRGIFLVPILVFKYVSFFLTMMATFAQGIAMAAALHMATCFIFGVFLMFVYAFLFTQNAGFNIVLYSIMKHNEKSLKIPASQMSMKV